MRCITFILSVYLTACVTAPNPEKYLELTCENLSDLTRAYSDNISQYKLFNDDDINEVIDRIGPYSDDFSGKTVLISGGNGFIGR